MFFELCLNKNTCCSNYSLADLRHSSCQLFKIIWWVFTPRLGYKLQPLTVVWRCKCDVSWKSCQFLQFFFTNCYMGSRMKRLDFGGHRPRLLWSHILYVLFSLIPHVRNTWKKFHNVWYKHLHESISKLLRTWVCTEQRHTAAMWIF